MTDDYHVYGNFLDENPHEALFQAEGNVAFYSNVLRNRSGRGIAIQPPNDVPREIRIFENTIITAGDPIVVRVNDLTPPGRQFVSANAVFSPFAIQGGMQSDNVVYPIEEAPALLATATQEGFNPFPRGDALRCAKSPAAAAKGLTDARCDFNGQQRLENYCGAYAGQSRNPGWLPVLAIKPKTECRAR